MKQDFEKTGMLSLNHIHDQIVIPMGLKYLFSLLAYHQDYRKSNQVF